MSSSTTPPDYQTKLWINKGDQLKFPEKEAGVQQNTGVCFSGGGTRALSATMGQLRGLEALKLIDKVDYISCVSGGSWASSLFTYYKSNPNGIGPITDADFLGPVVQPHDIVVNKPNDPADNWLGKNDPKRLGSVATNSLVDVLFGTLLAWVGDYLAENGLWPDLDNIKKALENVDYKALWISAVGYTYFEPFGLFSYAPFKDQPFYSLDKKTVADIRARNANTPEVKTAKFDLVRDEAEGSKRPFLIINASVVGPTSLTPFKEENPIVFEYTPLYVGSAYSPYGKPFEYKPGKSFLVGSGYVEPFAFGGDAPSKAATTCSPADPDAKCTSVPPPPIPFTLANASGVSSSAFASVISQNPVEFIKGLKLKHWYEKLLLGIIIEVLQQDLDLIQLAPQNQYWPVTGKAKEPTTTFSFGDGGILDNYGLISLLRRGVKNLVVFINTSTKIDTSYDPAHGAPKANQVDSDLAPMFGLKVPSPGIFTQHNQVFPKKEFAAVFNALKTAKLNGKPVMTMQTHTVCKNTWWGVDGVALNRAGNPKSAKEAALPDNKVNVLWVYSERVKEWENLLTTEEFHAKGLGDVTLKEAIEKGNEKIPTGPFQYFPNYLTAGQNGYTEMVELTPEQVNLLADLSCWSIINKDSAPLFKKILGGGEVSH